MRPGDKVICVDAKFPDVVGPQGLVEGAEYTVRTYGQYTHMLDGTYTGIRLMELQRGEDPAGFDIGDMPFYAHRFKPVVTGSKLKELETAQ